MGKRRYEAILQRAEAENQDHFSAGGAAAAKRLQRSSPEDRVASSDKLWCADIVVVLDHGDRGVAAGTGVEGGMATVGPGIDEASIKTSRALFRALEAGPAQVEHSASTISTAAGVGGGGLYFLNGGMVSAAASSSEADSWMIRSSSDTDDEEMIDAATPPLVHGRGHGGEEETASIGSTSSTAESSSSEAADDAMLRTPPMGAVRPLAGMGMPLSNSNPATSPGSFNKLQSNTFAPKQQQRSAPLFESPSGFTGFGNARLLHSSPSRVDAAGGSSLYARRKASIGAQSAQQAAATSSATASTMTGSGPLPIAPPVLPSLVTNAAAADTATAPAFRPSLSVIPPPSGASFSGVPLTPSTAAGGGRRSARPNLARLDTSEKVKTVGTSASGTPTATVASRKNSGSDANGSSPLRYGGGGSSPPRSQQAQAQTQGSPARLALKTTMVSPRRATTMDSSQGGMLSSPTRIDFSAVHGPPLLAPPPTGSGSGEPRRASAPHSAGGPNLSDEFKFSVSCILPDFLYLGPDVQSSEDVTQLKQLGVRRILNMAVEIPDGGASELGLKDKFDKYLKIPMRDTVEATGVQRSIEEACRYIGESSTVSLKPAKSDTEHRLF